MLMTVLRNMTHTRTRTLADTASGNILTTEFYSSGRYFIKPGKRRNKFRLTVSVNTGNADNFSCTHFKGNIVNSIYSSAYTILPVSTVLDGEYGISDVALSTLCAISKDGVVTTLTPKLSDDEMEKMRNSAEVLKGVIAQIEI